MSHSKSQTFNDCVFVYPFNLFCSVIAASLEFLVSASGGASGIFVAPLSENAVPIDMISDFNS